jgi:cell fate regulator YaaT (PSP1 superfamily)
VLLWQQCEEWIAMSSIAGVKFREYGNIYYFEIKDLEVSMGDWVVVDQGQGLGEVVVLRDDVPADAESDELKQVNRLAENDDLARHQENEGLSREAFQYCLDCVRERKLDMKLVDVEVFFDRSKIIFYFTAPNRIDFRELVKDLVKNYRTRIELRQIGVRHETQMVGAVGNCGMVCCCRRFLRKFAPVTIKMAKEQNLFLNPAKISGICGRLLCCLSYEQQNYEEFHRACPKLGKKYFTEDGSVKVLRANMFRNSVSLLSEFNEEMEVTLEEWAEMKATRPDQALQDAARAAAKKAAEDAAREEQEAIEAEEEEARRVEVEKELEERAEAEGVDVDTLREQLVRKPGVKSADPMKRTSRGKRKRKRKPKSDE